MKNEQVMQVSLHSLLCFSFVLYFIRSFLLSVARLIFAPVDFPAAPPYKPANFVRRLDMVRLLARLRRSLARRSTPTRRKTARPDVELLELRAQPATAIAPDLVASSDTGLSSMDNITSAATPRF